MSAYVDGLRMWGPVPGAPRAKYWCHLIADSLDELHAVAAAIGMRREWFQDAVSCPHYDLTGTRRAAAIDAGAVVLSRKAFVEKMREIRGARV